MPASQVLSHRELLERARQHAKQAAQASAPQGDPVSDVKDPQEKGTVTPPTHPSQAKTEASMPAGTTGAPNSEAEKPMETKELQADGVGKAPTPGVTGGDVKDDGVSSPTAKLAKSVASTAASLRALATKAAGETKAEPTDTTKTEVSEKKEDKEKLPKDLPADKGIPPFAEKKEEAKAEKSAGTDDLELPTDAYVKLASVILETDEGVALATRLLKQAKGAQAAEALINNAIAAQEDFAKAASAHAQGAGLVDQIFANATPAEAEQIIKFASAHNEQVALIEAQGRSAEAIELEKMAYAAGAMDAGAMDENGGELPGGGEETSDEDILAVIQQLVESGQLPAEVAEQLLMELQGGGGAEAEGAETEEEKSAAAKDPIAAMVGAHRKSASETAKLTAELIRSVVA